MIGLILMPILKLIYVAKCNSSALISFVVDFYHLSISVNSDFVHTYLWSFKENFWHWFRLQLLHPGFDPLVLGCLNNNQLWTTENEPQWVSWALEEMPFKVFSWWPNCLLPQPLVRLLGTFWHLKGEHSFRNFTYKTRKIKEGFRIRVCIEDSS